MAPTTPAASLGGTLLPLSLSQREVWLDQRAWPGSSHLNIGGCGFLVGPLDVDRYRQALGLLVAETEALRLVPQADGSQRLVDPFEPDLALVDLTDAPNPKQAMREWWQEKIRQPFAAHDRPPWRFILLRGGRDLHGVTIQFHHSIMDGWGTTQLARRWSEIHNALAAGIAPPPNQAPPYRHFIEESLAYRAAPAFAKDGAYWSARLPTVPPPLIERRYHRTQSELPPAQLVCQPLPRAEYERLGRFAAERRLSTFTVLLAAVALYFARTRQRRQIVVGVPSLNRAGNRYLATPGMFVGVLPLVIDVDCSATLDELMATVHGAMREALRHPRYPLSELSRRLQALRNSRDGLFDVLLSFERQDYSIAFGAARLVDSRQLFAGLARYPLSVTICEFHAEQDLELVLEGSTACFGAGEVELLGQRFRHLLSVLTECPERTVDRVDVLPPAERWALVDGLHRRVASHEDPQPFIRLFERQAALRADAVALVWDGGRWTYGALDRRADRLARRLLTMAVRRGSVVAMALERAPEMVVALLAIAKCGAAFLPLDPETPPARLREILADSEAVALLIQQRNRDRLATLHGSVESIDDAADDLGACDPMPPVALLADDLAYVLFTSGSSGRPKGVVIDHGTLARRLAWLSRTYAVCWSDRSGQATQYTFDPALIELCLPLINGASIALPPAGQLAPAALADFAIGQAVTIMAFVPATLERFVDAVAGRPGLCLRVACCGGEVLAPELANRFLRETGARLYNVYGPTETAIFATAWPCQAQAEATPLPIGWAIDDTRIHVLDERGQPLPFGEAGEIHIGGRAIGRGYLNRPDLTAAAFIADPFHPGGRLYRTGDLGWLDCDGKLHFRGRRDRQIKLRGYRIELGEIEAALLAIDGVRRAAACLWHGEGRPAIQAWVAGDGTQDGTALRQALRQRLPDYMLPTSVACLAHLPETTSGKIDYDALPAPRHPLADGHRRVADGDLEIRLTTLWQSALGKRQLSVQDNFFDLGGDSLAAVDILAGVERLLGRKAPLYLLTENPTIERLARALAETTATTPPILRLGKPVGAPALYLAASGHGDLLRFQSLAQALDGRFDLHMLQPPDAASVASIGDLADLYAERIVARGDSPGYLAGFSVGGIAALETARRLRERGLAVNGLVLIDTVYPSALVRAWRLWQGFGWLTRLLHVQELSMNGRRLGAMFSDPGLVAQVMALGGYCPAPYEGTTLLIKSSGLANWQRWLFRPWRGLLARGQIAEAESPGLHGSLFDPGNVGALAARLAAMLPGQDGHARHDA